MKTFSYSVSVAADADGKEICGLLAVALYKSAIHAVHELGVTLSITHKDEVYCWNPSVEDDVDVQSGS